MRKGSKHSPETIKRISRTKRERYPPKPKLVWHCICRHCGQKFKGNFRRVRARTHPRFALICPFCRKRNSKEDGLKFELRRREHG